LKKLLEHDLYIPKKNGKIRKLTEEEKEMNQLISSFRVKAEHVISHVKKYNIEKYKFRNRIT